MAAIADAVSTNFGDSPNLILRSTSRSEKSSSPISPTPFSGNGEHHQGQQGGWWGRGTRGQSLLRSTSAPAGGPLDISMAQRKGLFLAFKQGLGKSPLMAAFVFLLGFLTAMWSSSVFLHNIDPHKVSAKCVDQGGQEVVRRLLLSTKLGGSDNLPQLTQLGTDGSVALPLERPLSLTIFCAPKGYTGEKDDGQRRALLSWLRLQPTPKIVILGDDPSFFELEKEFPGYLTVEKNIDFNFLGVPQFHSMMARAQAADTDLSMIINGDIILLNDLLPAVQKVAAYFKDFVVTAARWDVKEDFPFSFEGLPDTIQPPRGLWSTKAPPKEIDEEVIYNYTRANGSLHTYGGVDFWLWNNSPAPLYSVIMPPFVFGRGKYDNWMTHEMIFSGTREVIDASDSVTSIHVAHSYAHVAMDNATSAKVGVNFWSEKKKSSFELFANIHLAEKEGSYTNQKGTAVHIPWRMATCYEPGVDRSMCLLKRIRPANCSCEYSSYANATQSDPKLLEKKWTCGSISVDKKSAFEINPIPAETGAAGTGKAAIPGLPHTLEQLLPNVADENKVVILVAVTNGYNEMLMNFNCRLRQLGLGQHLLVAALDEDLYRFAFLQGLAVYYEQVSAGLKDINEKDCGFGSQCFRQFTKLKSRAVLHVLKQGYNVLWTDVDIVWFKNPLPQMMSFGPGTFPIQSNEPNATLPPSGIRRINSGLYFARSDPLTIKAFEAITDHASKTKLSEQPSFYDVLCGVKGELLTSPTECKWNGLRVIFLDRKIHPNGAVHSIWDAPNVTESCLSLGCLTLHNNWILGKDAKIERFVKNGYWIYDPATKMCKHDWYASIRGFQSGQGAKPAAK